MFSSATDLWSTPQDFFDRLNAEFGFVLDVCATHENHKCLSYYTVESDGLKHDWALDAENLFIEGRTAVWMNPPYGEPEHPCKPKCKKKRCAKRRHHNPTYRPGIRDWVKKAHEESLKGCTVVCLLPVRTDTKWFHRFIWDKTKHQPRPGVEIRPEEGRLKFGGSKNSAPFPSVVVVFRPPTNP